MLFKRPVQRYGRTPQPVFPYTRSSDLWDGAPALRTWDI